MSTTVFHAYRRWILGGRASRKYACFQIFYLPLPPTSVSPLDHQLGRIPTVTVYKVIQRKFHLTMSAWPPQIHLICLDGEALTRCHRVLAFRSTGGMFTRRSTLGWGTSSTTGPCVASQQQQSGPQCCQGLRAPHEMCKASRLPSRSLRLQFLLLLEATSATGCLGAKVYSNTPTGGQD